jgi:hypothetical protein
MGAKLKSKTHLLNRLFIFILFLFYFLFLLNKDSLVSLFVLPKIQDKLFLRDYL